MYLKLYAEIPVDLLIRSEFKKDTIDYSDITTYYYRERLSVFFSKESVLNLSYIYLEQEKDYKYTWNIILNDISPDFYLIAGNYFAHFGSGLLMGQKRNYDPDIFSFRTTDSSTTTYKSAFTPCNTGNPVFAFNGLGSAFVWQAMETKFALNAFYSIKERYIDEDSYDSNKIAGSIDTLDGKTKEEYNHNEPVEIHTCGARLSGVIFNCILIETYYVNADIRSLYKDQIQWEYNESLNESRGILELNGFGIFSQYKDDYLNLLIDGVVTQKDSLVENDRRKDYGLGVLYKLSFTPPFLRMTLAGKEVDSSFYSPYGSSIGEDYPESAWFFDTEFKPYSNIKLLTKFSSEKRTAPSSMDEEIPVIQKEIITFKYFYEWLEEFEIAVKRREKTDEEKTVTKQLHTSTDIAITNAFKINLSSTYNRINNCSSSALFITGFQLLVTDHFKMYINYLFAKISKDNSIYAAITPLRDSSTQGYLIAQDSNAVVIKSDLTIGEIFFSGRYFYQYNKTKPLHTRLEFYASGYF